MYAAFLRLVYNATTLLLPILSLVSFAPALNVTPATLVPILALVLPRLMSPVEVIYDPNSFPRPLDPFSIGAALLIE